MARIKQPDKLRLIDMMTYFEQYEGLPEGLVQMPVPSRIKIKGRYYKVPGSLDDFLDTLVYGQRIFFTKEETDDFSAIIRIMDCYYYPIVEKRKWNADNALLFGKNILTCIVEQVYPVAMHMIKLVSEMAEREHKLLQREPTKLELAAGIEKLNVFAELSSLDFLRDAMKITVGEVLQTPYKECLVRFMQQKEVDDYKERYMKLMNEKATAEMKLKTKGKAK